MCTTYKCIIIACPACYMRGRSMSRYFARSLIAFLRSTMLFPSQADRSSLVLIICRVLLRFLSIFAVVIGCSKFVNVLFLFASRGIYFMFVFSECILISLSVFYGWGKISNNKILFKLRGRSGRAINMFQTNCKWFVPFGAKWQNSNHIFNSREKEKLLSLY